MTRHVPLPQGDICWLFPTLTDTAEQDTVHRILRATDAVVYQVGEGLNARSDASFMGMPLNRLVYSRLGPEPELPVTLLVAEGWSDQICVDVMLAPVGRNPFTRPGPPWEVDAMIGVRCDSDPDFCRWHWVEERRVESIGRPMVAATELQLASEWLLQRIREETEQSLRARDPKRGHPPKPRNDD
jgi:hypothetical protein